MQLSCNGGTFVFMAIGLLPVLDQALRGAGNTASQPSGDWIQSMLGPPAPLSPLAGAARTVLTAARPAVGMQIGRTSLATSTPPHLLTTLTRASGATLAANKTIPFAPNFASRAGVGSGVVPMPSDPGGPVSAPGFANDMIPAGPSPGADEPPGVNPVSGSARFGAAAPVRALAPSGDQGDQNSSSFALHMPTWLLVSGVVVVAGLGAFALHRVLPAGKR